MLLVIRENMFPGPLAFWKKAVERIKNEKDILNTSVYVCVCVCNISYAI